MSGRIRRGQPALLRPQGRLAEESGAIPAIVTDVAEPAQGDPIRVTLYAQPSATNLSVLQAGLTGQVDVEVEHLSPASFVVRASGQFLDTPPVSLSPQTH